MQQNLIDAARAIGTKPVTGRYFLCLCSKCGWLGSSEETRLVEDPIFGDGEYFCAVCGASEPDEVDAAEAFNAMLAGTASRHPDDVAVDRFALAMKAKLADARAKGRTGWDDPAQCSVGYLAQLLVDHIGKDNAGNFEDVANLAMMLHQRGADPSVLAEAAGAGPVESTAPISTQWWLAELDQYGGPKLVDGDHADMAGANRALYLINALGLGAGRKYAAAKVQLFEAVPDDRGVNQGAIKQVNRTRLERGHD